MKEKVEKKPMAEGLSDRELIEAKIREYINSIMRKEHLEFADYQTLTAEASRLAAQEKAERDEREMKERNEKMNQFMACSFGSR